MTHVCKRFALPLVLFLTLWMPSWVGWAHPDCSIGQEPSLSPHFANLHKQLGDTIGDVLGCERDDWETGNAYVQTTNGIAVYHKASDRFTFTNGREFWSLSSEGVDHWTGWHGQAGPSASDPGQALQEEQLTVASIGHYPKAQTATIVRSMDAEGQQIVLQHAGTSYLVEIGGGCTDDELLEGRRVVVVSNNAFAEPGSRLILRISARECVIAASHLV